ncbi:MAG: hypothetical protein MJ180_04635 [Candidatus Gastranaerophilales bacterium]|nr:hypothetical protein [Candidatus Gastranaerophilales bacterium]
MEVSSISVINNNQPNFNGKFVASKEAKQLINAICPADEFVKSVSEICEKNSSDFIIKLEKATQKELDKIVEGFKICTSKEGINLKDNTGFLYAKNSEDLKYLFYAIGQIFQKL